MSVHSPAPTTPWSDPSRKVKDVAVTVTEKDATREVEWYQPVMKKLPSSTIEVFVNYAGLADEKETIEHIYAVRDKAWDVLPYPCIGLFRFLDFSIHLSPIYHTVIDRLRNGETLLDLGCCLGQDLRKVAYDSGVSTNLIGADIEAPFLELGYELFRDRDRFQGELRAGSIFDEDFLSDKYGKINMIYLGSFLHLFNTEQQAVIVAKLEKLLCPGPGALVFGRNLGAEQGGEFHMESIGWDLYRHSNETMQNLWASTGNRKWSVESSLSRYGSVAWDDSRRTWQGDETKQMMFVAISQ